MQWAACLGVINRSHAMPWRCISSSFSSLAISSITNHAANCSVKQGERCSMPSLSTKKSLWIKINDAVSSAPFLWCALYINEKKNPLLFFENRNSKQLVYPLCGSFLESFSVTHNIVVIIRNANKSGTAFYHRMAYSGQCIIRKDKKAALHSGWWTCWEKRWVLNYGDWWE